MPAVAEHSETARPDRIEKGWTVYDAVKHPIGQITDVDRDRGRLLIDGRSVYSPLFAGVFWDANDVVLEDVERIEVISGPGGTLWGANAVNGVINIVSKPAAETQGGLARVEAGGAGSQATTRYGGAAGDMRCRGLAHPFHTGRQEFNGDSESS